MRPKINFPVSPFQRIFWALRAQKINFFNGSSGLKGRANFQVVGEGKVQDDLGDRRRSHHVIDHPVLAFRWNGQTNHGRHFFHIGCKIIPA